MKEGPTKSRVWKKKLHGVVNWELFRCKDLRLLNSTDLNSLDYFVGAYIETLVNRHPHTTKASLMTSINWRYSAPWTGTCREDMLSDQRPYSGQQRLHWLNVYLTSTWTIDPVLIFIKNVVFGKEKVSWHLTAAPCIILCAHVFTAQERNVLLGLSNPV